MHIALVLQSPPSAGGANHYERALHSLLTEICLRNDISLSVFSTVEAEGGDRVSIINESKIDYFKLVIALAIGKKFPKFSGQISTRFSKSIAALGIDCVYFASPNKLALDPNLPCIVTTVWDLGHRELPRMPETGGRGRWLIRELYFRKTTRDSSYIVTDSPKTNSNLQRFYNLDTNKFVSIGLLPANHIEVTDDPIFNFNYFLYPAQRWRHKNHKTILKALQLVVKDHPNVRLVFTGGDKGEGKRIQRLVKTLGLSSSVVDLGFVDEGTLMNLQRYAVALLMPSLLGPTNIPPLDALNFGTPAIVSDVHEFPIDLQSKMVIVPALDYVGWAQEMVTALSQPRQKAVIHSDHLARLHLEKMLTSIRETLKKTVVET